jgi:hypothetical protein
MAIRLKWLLLAAVSVLMAACSGPYAQEFVFHDTFESDLQDWETGFADLPADYDQEIFMLDLGWSELPSGLEGQALFLSGNNASSDLFMYVQKHITGLRPESTYRVQFSVELASSTPAGMVGIGGSPGESVYVKAGAVDFEPDLVKDSSDWLRVNIDKGNQASEGEDMINLGTLANPNLDLETFTGEEYALMTLTNEGTPFEVSSNDEGEIWVLIGTDSGFAGATMVFVNSIEITLTEVR